MNSKPPLSILTLLAFASILFSGCQDSAPEKGNSKANATGNQEASSPKISLDELLARTDLNDRARKAFERTKGIGQHEMARSVADQIIKNSFQKKEVLVSPKTSRRSPQTPQPTLSHNDNPTAGSDIDTTPISNEQWINASIEYLTIGVDHFEKRFIYGMPDDVRVDAATWMRNVVQQFYMSDNDDQWQSLYEQAAVLAARAEPLRDEPMFCFCRATAASFSVGGDAAVKYFERAWENFRSSEYPTRMPIYCYQFDRLYTPKRDSRRIKYEAVNVAFFHWIEKDFRAIGHDQRFAVQAFDSFFKMMLARNDTVALKAFEASIKNSKQLTAWTKAILLGQLNYRISYYPGYYRNSIPEAKNWTFKEFWKFAEQHWVDAYQLRPEFCDSVEMLLTLAKQGHTEQDEDYWFEKAIEYEPDRLNVYQQQVERLYPSNGGSAEKMLDFLLHHTKDNDSLTLDFLLPREIFRCRNNGEFDADQWQELITNPKVSEATLAALDKIISSGQNVPVTTQVFKPKFFLTVKAIFASQAKKYSVAEETFDELGDQLSKDGIRCFSIDHSSFTQMRSSVYAFTSEYQADAFKLEKLWGNTYKTRHENADKILELTERLGDWVDTNSGGLYFKHARNILMGELNFEDETLPLKFDEGFTVWQSTDFSQIKFVDADSVEIDNREGGSHFQLKSAYLLPQAKIFECDFSFPEPDAADSPQPEASQQLLQNDKQGVFRPSVGVGMAGNDYLMIGLGKATKKMTRDRRKSPYNGVLSVSPNYSAYELVSYDVVLKPDGNRLKIAVCKGFTEIYLNDNFIFRFSGPMFNPASQVSFEQPRPSRGRGTVVISNPSIRKWAENAPDLIKRDPKALIPFYEKAVKDEPNDAWQKLWLGEAKHLADDYEGALKHYLEAVQGGISPRLAGYYLGDAYDRLGKHEEAVEWYRKSVDPTVEPYAKRRGAIKPSTPEQWAAFRLRWNLATKATLSEKEKDELEAIGLNLKLTGLENQLSYLAVKIAQGRLKKDYPGTLEDLQRKMKFHAKKGQEEALRKLLQPVFDALAAGKPYVRPESQPPLYLTFDDDKRFFY